MPGARGRPAAVFPGVAKTGRSRVARAGSRDADARPAGGTALAIEEQGDSPMLLGLYETKDELRHSVGQPLHYQETQLLICEYRPTGVVAVRGAFAGGDGHPWTAEVSLRDGHIVHVD